MNEALILALVFAALLFAGVVAYTIWSIRAGRAESVGLPGEQRPPRSPRKPTSAGVGASRPASRRALPSRRPASCDRPPRAAQAGVRRYG